jgi:hypothetical protein
MKHLVIILTVVLSQLFLISCEDEQIAPLEQEFITNPINDSNQILVDWIIYEDFDSVSYPWSCGNEYIYINDNENYCLLESGSFNKLKYSDQINLENYGITNVKFKIDIELGQEINLRNEQEIIEYSNYDYNVVIASGSQIIDKISYKDILSNSLSDISVRFDYTKELNLKEINNLYIYLDYSEFFNLIDNFEYTESKVFCKIYKIEVII